MPYTIDYADSGKTPIVLYDGTTDTSTSLVLIGKNYTRFGESLNENQLRLLENFANTSPPVNPTEGQLWYNTAESRLMLYDEQWWTIMHAGPTRVEFRQRRDTLNNYHWTIEHIVDGNIVTITVDDVTPWQPHATEYLEDGVTRLDTQFPTIQAGVNMNTTTNYKFRGIATSAEYADVAERYWADTEYEPGTVVKIGGPNEITQTTTIADPDVFGVISTAPGVELNAGAGPDETHPFVALAGRVPCKVDGVVRKGARLISSNAPGHAQALNEELHETVDPRCIIGRALEDKTDQDTGVVEIVVGAI